jgi:hypothetical protein
MSKKHFIALADTIREHNRVANHPANSEMSAFSTGQIQTLAIYCQQQNSNFKRERWLDYIAGVCGKNGGAK